VRAYEEALAAFGDAMAIRERAALADRTRPPTGTADTAPTGPPEPDEAIQPAPTLTGPGPHRDGGGPLTARQQEVAVLVTRGFSNKRVAGALVLERGTVANHVANILRRLRVHGRAQVAAWAVREGLVPAEPE
jgi:DNA-binding NarL/FixJ family response regulator